MPLKNIGNVFLLIFIFITLLPSTYSAYFGPPTNYCTEMGYKIEIVNHKDLYCSFDDGKKCLFDDFWLGKCGGEYIKEILCKKDGEVTMNPSNNEWLGKTIDFDECCLGLIETEKPGWMGNPECFTQNRLRSEKFKYILKQPGYYIQTFLTDDDAFIPRIILGLALATAIIWLIIKKIRKSKNYSTRI